MFCHRNTVSTCIRRSTSEHVSVARKTRGRKPSKSSRKRARPVSSDEEVVQVENDDDQVEEEIEGEMDDEEDLVNFAQIPQPARFSRDRRDIVGFALLFHNRARQVRDCIALIAPLISLSYIKSYRKFAMKIIPRCALNHKSNHPQTSVEFTNRAGI
ncbi:hypothetical protein PRIPAC_80971 [Pristionchus pacificus]|uniref:Uncharacterized protein n=1 Tax=Pristionchus pacificus TaxID=54126 RepID=A0A2A6CNZ6_PRIPA|nr:hypothetical protein PRIPAC_80971 [Pristionchus pacificus]|eukprot:PDM79922.1 hypothetical protein PRIPAC_32501 [Pristionchus pacificus]